MDPTDLPLLVAMALAAYAPKAAPLMLASERRTARLRPWLRYIAPAVLGALVAPAILPQSGHGALVAGSALAPYVIAGVAAFVTRRMVPSLALGLAALVVVTLLKN